MSNYSGNLNFVSDNYSRVVFVILNFMDEYFSILTFYFDSEPTFL